MKNSKDKFFSEYFDLFISNLKKIEPNDLIKIYDLIIKTKKTNNKVIVLGNGASASISSHFAVDLTKFAKVRAINFNEANLITCLANDYGHDNWMDKAIDFYGDKGDLIIFVSSSGKSKNIVTAAKKAFRNKYNIITLSGFSSKNPLKKYGLVNLWVDSKIYNVVENIHQTWLLSIVDYIVGKNKKK